MLWHFLNASFPSSVFRELLQNSDDAQSHVVEVHFNTAAYLDRRDQKSEVIDVPIPPDLKTTSVLAFGSPVLCFADLIFQGYPVDVQKQWESVYRERLDPNPDNWCVNYYYYPRFPPYLSSFVS